jgi:hypothetical protein
LLGRRHPTAGLVGVLQLFSNAQSGISPHGNISEQRLGGKRKAGPFLVREINV